jgi:hypothetical protein
MREGQCGEWRSIWNVEQNQGLWTGFIDHIHVGGPCAAPTGQRARTTVQAIIAGEIFLLPDEPQTAACATIMVAFAMSGCAGLLYVKASPSVWYLRYG